jgi:hypothetical protein
MNFAELTAPEIRALPRDSTLVIAPIAAMEQRGRTCRWALAFGRLDRSSRPLSIAGPRR